MMVSIVHFLCAINNKQANHINQIIEEDFTIKGWQDRIKIAELVAGCYDTDITQINEMKTMLNGAMGSLVAKPAGESVKTILNALITSVSGLDEPSYTNDSWAAFNAAMNGAKSVRDNVGSVNDEYLGAISALNTAVSALVRDIDKTALNALIAESKGVSKGVYSDESWENFQSALKEAQAVSADENATQTKVDTAYTALYNAKARLAAPTEEDKGPVLVSKELSDVLKGVSLEVPRGCLYAVMGGNGTGKSTMLKAICHICRPYRGKVMVDGKRVEKYKAGDLFSGNLAMLPQDPQCLFVKKTVREDLMEMLTGVKAAGRDMRVADIAAATQITHLLDAHPYDLSGGEQQRAALAKVLLTKPRILLLDEPTKGIDAFFKRQLVDILRKLIDSGATVLMVSHDVEFCARYADAVALFFDGSVITTGTPGNFFATNSFYTTAANRMSRHLFKNAVTNEEVIALCRQNRL